MASGDPQAMLNALLQPWHDAVADPAQAAEIARATKARVALPMHIGTLFGTWAEVERFKELADCQVVLSH